ncbi:MAG TPA: hypothetical protein DCK95_05225 [Anaerolineaceae bacterium]|uniref:Putative membrane protein n=1 Tax=Anaerolinea thermophila TaxID=167964 RepID=A0A117LH33_9CHLR|nr:MAG: putative membrane protein [Anaerolinea thermophila]HAF61707.1 hypothetical protein [Anaerolineaceae bacterium]
MNDEQVFALPLKRTIKNILLLCLFLVGISMGCILVANTLENPGFRILLRIAAILILIPFLLLVMQMVRILRSKYRIDREGLTIQWGYQKMVIPIQEIEWIRPVDQMGYSIPLPTAAKLGIFTGKTYSPELGDILFFATQQQDAFLIGTTQEVIFLSPSDADAFQKGLQESVYLGSITPLERKSISVDSPFITIRTNLHLYLPIAFSFLLNLGLFVLVGFLANNRETIQVGTVLFESTSNLVVIPILALLLNILDGILIPFLYKNESLRPYAFLTSYSGLITTLLLSIAIVISIL